MNLRFPINIFQIIYNSNMWLIKWSIKEILLMSSIIQKLIKVLCGIKVMHLQWVHLYKINKKIQIEILKEEEQQLNNMMKKRSKLIMVRTFALWDCLKIKYKKLMIEITSYLKMRIGKVCFKFNKICIIEMINKILRIIFFDLERIYKQ